MLEGEIDSCIINDCFVASYNNGIIIRSIELHKNEFKFSRKIFKKHHF